MLAKPSAKLMESACRKVDPHYEETAQTKNVDYSTIKVVVHACYRSYFVAHVFKYLAPNFVSRRPALCYSLEFLYNLVWNL